MRLFKRFLANRLRADLPWYVNATLSPHESRRIERWLKADPQAQAELEALRRLKSAVAAQPQATPAPAVQQHLMQRVAGAPAAPREAWRWTARSIVSGAVLAALVLVLLWFVVQPGVVLEWTVEAGAPATFRVYRAPLGTQAFELVGEVTSSPGVTKYHYIDSRLLPGRAYTYRVEGLMPGKLPALSRAITTSSLTALPGQVAILFASLVAGYSLAVFMQSWLNNHSGLKRRDACAA